jgi:two-component system, LytTR family, response regulator
MTPTAPFKAILIDDKPTNMRLLETLIRNYCPSLEIAATAADLDTAFSSICQHQPQVVFLDIEMPGGTGFDLLHRFNPVFFEVIFTTAYSEYAVKAFAEQALDYLLKPIDIDALQLAVMKAGRQIGLKRSQDRLLDYLDSKPKEPGISKIALPSLDGYIFVHPADILRCEASGSYTSFYLNDGQKILVSMRLKACEQLLPAALFFRIHHSHIVNLTCIRKYVKGRGGYIQLNDGMELDVAVNRRDEFLDLIRRQHG